MKNNYKNDFDGYNEAHSMVENGIAKCKFHYRNPKEERMNWLIANLLNAEKVLKRYGLDDNWCSSRKKPNLREIVRSYILNDLKTDEAGLRIKAPHLFESFSFDQEERKIEKTTEQDLSPEAIIPARQSLIRSDRGLAMAGLVDSKIELPGGGRMTAKDWIMIDVMTEAALKWIKDKSPDLISFSDDDVWMLTGMKDWHVNKIKETFRRVHDLKIIAPCKTQYDKENNTWKQTTYYGHVFDMIKIETYGPLLGRKGKVIENRSVKHKYYFFPNELYDHLLYNLDWKKALCLNKKLYHLSDEAQIIYRRFSLFKYHSKGSFFTFTQLAQLLGWPTEGSKQLISYRLKRIKLLLVELAEEGFILSEVKGSKKRGRETIFHLKEPEKGLKT